MAFQTRLTTFGKNRIAQASVPNGPKLAISAMAVGDGGGTTPDPTINRTALVGEQYRSTAITVRRDPPNQGNTILCEMRVPATVGGFTVREVGIFEGSSLVAQASFPETYKPTPGEGATQDLIVRLLLRVADIEAVTIAVDASIVTATRDYVDTKVAEASDADRQDADTKIAASSTADRQYADTKVAEKSTADRQYADTKVADKSTSDRTFTSDAVAAQAARRGKQSFTASGTFVVPANVTRLEYQIWGGGGGGGGSFGEMGAGGGGCGGGYVEGVATVLPGQSIAVTIGIGGAGGDGSPTDGANGGTSSLGAIASATGGMGGRRGLNELVVNSGRTGGIGSGGAVRVPGGGGGNGYAVALDTAAGGIGGSAYHGSVPSLNIRNAGHVGTFPGGGANGGCYGFEGGAGAPGFVVLTW